MNLIDNQTEEMNVQEEEYLLPDDYVEGEEYDFDNEESETAESEEAEVEETVNKEVDTIEEESDTEEEVSDDTTEEAKTKLSELLGFEDYKFNHKEGKVDELTPEEVQMYLQIGMKGEYDVEKAVMPGLEQKAEEVVAERYKERLNQAYDQLDDFKDIADMFEMDLSTVIDTLKNQYYNNKAEQEGRKAEDVKREYESNKKDRNTKMYERFLSKYPDIKTDDIPQEVMQAVREGEDLVNAYDKHMNTSETKAKDSEIQELKAQIEELNKKLDVNNQNKKTKKKAVVKKTSDTSGVKTDPFLEGLLGDY